MFQDQSLITQSSWTLHIWVSFCKNCVLVLKGFILIIVIFFNVKEANFLGLERFLWYVFENEAVRPNFLNVVLSHLRTRKYTTISCTLRYVNFTAGYLSFTASRKYFSWSKLAKPILNRVVKRVNLLN